jgi:hypothetical protein
MEIYLLIEGKQEGPYSEDQVRDSLAAGQIPSDLPAERQRGSLLKVAIWLSIVLMFSIQLSIGRAEDWQVDGELCKDVKVTKIENATVFFTYTDRYGYSRSNQMNLNDFSPDIQKKLKGDPKAADASGQQNALLAQDRANTQQSSAPASQADSSPSTTSSSNGGAVADDSILDTYLKEALKPTTTPESNEEKFKTLDQLYSSHDQELPNDVLDAVKFIRSAIGPASHLTVVQKGGYLVFTSMWGFTDVALIHDLNPQDIQLVSKSDSSVSYGQLVTNNGYGVTLFTTGRKPLIKVYSGYAPAMQPQMSFGTNSNEMSQRLAHAFSDIITHYGGKPELSVEGAKTAKELASFIQEKLTKALPLYKDVTYDDATSEIKIGANVPDYVVQTIKVKDLNPDRFSWDKSEGNPSVLNIGAAYLHLANEQDAQDVAKAFQRLCEMNGWTPSKY